MRELSDDSSFAQHFLDTASPSVKSPTIDAQLIYPAADELNTVMLSASTYR